MNSCPDGYSCTSGACWRNGGGSGGSGGNSSGHGGGGGSTGGSGGNSTAAKFVGTWAFIPAATTRTRVCTDGTNEVMNPYTDGFDITAGSGSAATLVADYYCLWNLDLTSGGTTTAIRSGQMCTKPDPNTPTTSFTWHGQTFTFMTTDGSTGTAQISLPYDYTTSSGSGSCTMTFMGSVTKQ